AVERLGRRVAGGQARSQVLDLGVSRVDFGHDLSVAASRDHPDVVTRLSQQLGVGPENRLDAAGYGRGRVVEQRQTPRPPGAGQRAGTRPIRSTGALLSEGSSSVSPDGLRSTWTRAPPPHSMVKSISPSPTRMPSTLRRR